MIGRERELERIGAFLDGGRSPARMLLLEGVAGIGKTTLWRSAVEAARRRGLLVLAGSGSPAEVRLGFALVADLLDAHVERVLPLLPPPQARAMAVALHRAEAEGVPPGPATTAFAVLSSLRALAGDRRVLVAVDDVQWIDGPSASALAFALRRLDEDVLLVVAQRTDAGVAPPLGVERLPEDAVVRLGVEPLGLGALSTVVCDRLGIALARPALRRIHEASGGNPFFALEIARALVRRGGRVAPGESLPVPSALAAEWAERVALPAATRDALLVVASARDPSPGLIAAALETDDALPILAPALDADLVEVGGGRVRFTHPLIAASVVARADGARRRRSHLALARVAATTEERARHLALGSDPPDEHVAAALDEATLAAAAHGSPASAAELAELAAAFGDPRHATAQQRRQCDAADLHRLAGDVARASELARRIVEHAPAGVLRARALFVLGFAEQELDTRTAHVSQALVEAAGASELIAAIESFRVLIGISCETVGQARAYAENALAHAETAAARAHAASLVVLTDVLAGAEVASDALDEAFALEASAGASLLYGPSMVHALRLTFEDRPEAAAEAFEHALRRAAAYGDEVTIAGLLFHRAELHCRAGALRRGADDADRAFAVCEQSGMAGHVRFAAAVQAFAHSLVGDEAITRAKAAEVGAVSGYWEVHANLALGLLDLSRGDAASAAAILEPLPAALFRAGFGEPWHLQAVPAAIEARAAIGSLDEAEHLLRRYEQVVAPGPFGRAAAARSRGIVAAARGDTQRALGAFADALREHDAIETPFERARTLLALGRAQRRATQRRAARASLEAAHESFQARGARLWAERAREELGRIGGRAAAARGLTATERRIAELVAEGRTNREVAETLVVAERTVEGALTQIYRKLGVRSRTELVRRLMTAAGGEPADEAGAGAGSDRGAT